MRRFVRNRFLRLFLLYHVSLSLLPWHSIAIQRRRKAERKAFSYRNKKATFLYSSMTRLWASLRRSQWDLSTEMGDFKLRGWVSRVLVSRAIFTIAFACVRDSQEIERGLWGLRGRGGRHPAVSSGRRVHNTDGPMISEILHGTKGERRDARTRLHMHGHTRGYTRAHTHVQANTRTWVSCIVYLPAREGMVTLYHRRDIMSWRSSSP